MVRVTAKAQLEEAQRLGHVLSIVRQELAPGMPPKLWLECTCGYRSTARRSEKAVMGTLIWHLGKVLGEADENSAKNRAEMRRNGR